MRSSLIFAFLAFAAPSLHALELPALNQPVTSLGAAVTADYLYTYGGHRAKSHSWSLDTTDGTLYRLNLKEPTKWESILDGPKVQSPGVAAFDGKLYVVGGMQPQNKEGEDPVLKSLDHALMYDGKTAKWVELPKLPEIRSSHDVAILDGKLYVIGGWPLDTSADEADTAPDDRHNHRPFHQHSLVLDLSKPETGWQKIEQPFQRRAVAVVGSKGKIYVIGGMDEENKVSDEVDVYDVAEKKWSKLPNLPTEGRMKGFATAACELNGEVIASPRGGKIFALRNDTWQEVGKLANNRFFHQLEPLNGTQVIAVGGTTGESPLDNVEVSTISAAQP